MNTVGNGKVFDGRIRPGGRFYVVARDAQGNELWREDVHNDVVNQGLDYAHDVALLGATQISGWYIAFLDASPTFDVANDTYASAAGWTEITNYTEANRQQWNGADTGVGSSSNSAAKATVTIDTGGATIGGIALVGGGAAATTKGDTAGGGTLYSEAAFASDRVLNESDTLTVQYDQSHADDGV